MLRQVAALSFAAMLLAGCAAPAPASAPTAASTPAAVATTAPSPPAEPTVNVQGTVQAAIGATLAALSTPQAIAPTLAPTKTPPSPTSKPPTATVVPPTPTVVVHEDPTTISGHGTSSSKPFTLLRANYSVAWTAHISGSSDFCAMTLMLTKADNQSPLVREILQQAENTGETNIYRIPARDDFYVDVSGCGDWSITFTPQ